MKKILATCVLGLGFAASSQAATILGFEIGAGVWNTNNTLSTKNPIDKKTDSSYATNVYAAFEHPIPFVPNVRAEYVQNNNDLKSVKGESDTSYADVTLYYEILDNWVNLDVGISGRVMDAEYKTVGQSYKNDKTLGALYARAQFDLPLTGLSIGAAAQHDAGLNGNRSMEDYSIYMQYKIGLGFGVAGGYRLQDYTLDYDNTANEVSYDIKGAYLNVFWQF